MQVPTWTEQDVWKSKRPLLACNLSVYALRRREILSKNVNLDYFKTGNKVIMSAILWVETKRTFANLKRNSTGCTEE